MRVSPPEQPAEKDDCILQLELGPHFFFGVQMNQVSVTSDFAHQARPSRGAILIRRRRCWPARPRWAPPPPQSRGRSGVGWTRPRPAVAWSVSVSASASASVRAANQLLPPSLRAPPKRRGLNRAAAVTAGPAAPQGAASQYCMRRPNPNPASPTPKASQRSTHPCLSCLLRPLAPKA